MSHLYRIREPTEGSITGSIAGYGSSMITSVILNAYKTTVKYSKSGYLGIAMILTGITRKILTKNTGFIKYRFTGREEDGNHGHQINES